MKNLLLALGFFSALMLAACGGDKGSQGEARGETGAADPAALLDAVLAGDHRTEEEKARDAYRHPKETLLFFGLEPGMTVVEAWPGGGWYTQILAPFLREGGGKLYAAGFSRIGATDRVLSSLADFRLMFLNKPSLYGDVEMTVLGKGGEIAPPGSADMIVTFRNVHNWMPAGDAETYFKEFYTALKPGGVLGVVDHRADGADLPRDGSSGYLYTDDVVALAEKAGFILEASSDINANPQDTKDYPFGVWTLPPSKRSSEVSGFEDQGFDRKLYDAIGESDRMTLKFRKPYADGALLE